MKKTILPLFLTGMILLLIMAVPVLAESSTITTISPAVGYTGSTATVTITGTDFNATSVKVKLMMDDETNITSTISSHTSTTIVCKFIILSSKETGDWNLVVINEDDSEAVEVEGFTIRDPMTLTSISPASGQVNNESVDFALVGTGLSDVSDVYLYNEDYDNITASLDETDAEEITGTFDLTDVEEDTYDVCVEDSFGTVECDLTFVTTSDAVGSIDLSSSPTGALIYVDDSYKGTTPDTVDDLIEGSHKVILKKSGYTDWAKMVKVTEGETTTVDADLEVITTVPTTVATTVPTIMSTTAKPAVKSTVKVPTPWPSATATTATPTTTASPLDPLVILCAVGIGLIAVRKL